MKVPESSEASSWHINRKDFLTYENACGPTCGKAGNQKRGFTARKPQHGAQRNTYLCFVFFCEPRGVCVGRVGDRDIDVIWLHLRVRNDIRPFGEQDTVSQPPVPACARCRPRVGNTALLFSKGGKAQG